MATSPLAPAPRGPSLYHNWISWFSTGLAGYSFSILVILYFTNLLLGRPNPYLGVLTYLVLPPFFIAGLLGIPLGMWLEAARRRRRPGQLPTLPVLDLNLPGHRRRFVGFWLLSFVFVAVLALTAYSGYEFTESVEFCGQTCHTVMEPTYVAYQSSPHARVSCTDCHIGPGATWYVRSKFSGLYQVYAYAFNRYDRPIPVPVASLRPARETCEQCHWPSQFYDAVLRVRRYYLADETNTPYELHLRVPIGGGAAPAGREEGVHWHMLAANTVYYAAADPSRQVIPWVKAVRRDGTEVVYRAASAGEPTPGDNGAAGGDPPAARIRRLDCVDCHNQPSHVFQAPTEIVNDALASGAISPELPEVKQAAIGAMLVDYPSRAQGQSGVRERFIAFYAENYPEVLARRPARVEAAAAAVSTLYGRHFFPEMRTDWRAYPNNVGHWLSPGCLRCHDGEHRSDDGKVIAAGCDTCHTIVAQGRPGQLRENLAGMPFVHPYDDEPMTEPTLCTDCHDGTAMVSP